MASTLERPGRAVNNQVDEQIVDIGVQVIHLVIDKRHLFIVLKISLDYLMPDLNLKLCSLFLAGCKDNHKYPRGSRTRT